jgi:hypothetical protein
MVTLAWALLVLALAFLAGLHWLAAGLPLSLLCLSSFLLFRLALQGWIAVDRDPRQNLRIAAFLPYELGKASARGQLELFGQVPSARELSLDSTLIALSVESLAFAGPLGFIASLASAPAPLKQLPRGRFYRITGIAAPGVPAKPLPEPPYLRFLEALLPLPSGAALEPGSSPATQSSVFGLARRIRQTSQAALLIALEPVSFSLSPDGLPSIAAP